MKYGVIDIGSNSVRLMINKNGKTLYKLVNTTRLAEGLGSERILKAQSVDRTVSAVSFFVDKAKLEGVNGLFIFATAAVRNAVNSEEFIKAVKVATGYDVDVVSGEDEALIGRIGAIGNADGGIIDVGGASTEITAVTGGRQIYCKSLNVGAVSLKDLCGQDRNLTQKIIDEKIIEYGFVPVAEYKGIGGTATTLASIALELELYDPKRVEGFILDINNLNSIIDKLYSLSVEERKSLKGLQPSRAEVIAGGALLLKSIMQKIGILKLTISESDNLEGYLELKRSKDEKKR